MHTHGRRWASTSGLCPTSFSYSARRLANWPNLPDVTLPGVQRLGVLVGVALTVDASQLLRLILVYSVASCADLHRLGTCVSICNKPGAGRWLIKMNARAGAVVRSRCEQASAEAARAVLG